MTSKEIKSAIKSKYRQWEHEVLTMIDVKDDLIKVDSLHLAGDIQAKVSQLRVCINELKELHKTI